MWRWCSVPDRCRQAAAAAATTLCIPLSLALAAGARPYRLTPVVEFGPSGGPESVRAELALELRLTLATAACFQELGPAAGDAGEDDLVLLLTLDDYLDETRYETTLGQRSATTDPEVSRRVVAHVSALVTLEIRTARESAPLRHARYLQNAEWRPQISEDPREIAVSRLIDEIVRRSRKFACKGSAKQWEQELRKARGGAPQSR